MQNKQNTQIDWTNWKKLTSNLYMSASPPAYSKKSSQQQQSPIIGAARKDGQQKNDRIAPPPPPYSKGDQQPPSSSPPPFELQIRRKAAEMAAKKEVEKAQGELKKAQQKNDNQMIDKKLISVLKRRRDNIQTTESGKLPATGYGQKQELSNKKALEQLVQQQKMNRRECDWILKGINKVKLSDTQRKIEVNELGNTFALSHPL